jgi:hypothetical protein
MDSHRLLVAYVYRHSIVERRERGTHYITLISRPQKVDSLAGRLFSSFDSLLLISCLCPRSPPAMDNRWYERGRRVKEREKRKKWRTQGAVYSRRSKLNSIKQDALPMGRPPLGAARRYRLVYQSRALFVFLYLSLDCEPSEAK